MVDRGANIDIVFRNGLKDFEVMPPPEVWENIQPVIKVKPRRYLILRSAAIIAVLMTMGVLAYRWNSEILPTTDNPEVAFNLYPASKGTSNPETGSVIISSKVSHRVKKSTENTTEIVSEDAITPVHVPLNRNVTSSKTPLFQETTFLTLNNKKRQPDQYVAKLDSYQKYFYNLNSIDLQYLQSNTPVKEAERWSIAAMASPTYYSRFGGSNNDLTKLLSASEKATISYTGGVAFSYKMSKKVSIQSGLYYSSLGQVVEGVETFSGFQKYDYTKGSRNFEVMTSNGTIYTNSSDVYLVGVGSGQKILTNNTADVFDPKKASLQYVNNSLHQDFSYLELPIQVKYKIIDKMIDINLIGGVSYNLLVTNSVYAVTDAGKLPVGKTDGLNLLTVSSLFGMGMEYNLSQKLSLNIEPTFRYYLNPFNDLTGSRAHPYSFGVFSGVAYKF